MRQPFIICGAGTDVCNRVIVQACQAIRRSHDGWPEHVFALMADGDEQTRSRYRDARLPADRAPFVPLSLVQVREALAWRRDEFEDAWRDEWQALLVHGPDNGACMVPAIGRMMIKAARPALMQHLHAFERRLSAAGGKAPEIFIVWSPVSGTSRGSVLDLPRYLRAVFPTAAIHGVVIQPVGIAELDPAVGRIFQANFIEALRLIDHYSTKRAYRAWVDDQRGWQSYEGRLVDTVWAFDHRYGNLRLRQLGDPARTLPGRLDLTFARVAEFLAGLVGGDPLYERMRARVADADMHRADRMLAGHRSYLFSMHEASASLDLGTFRRALVERALVRITARLAQARRESGPVGTPEDDLFGVGGDFSSDDETVEDGA